MAKAVQKDRTLPHNLEAERALLGSVLLDNSNLNHIEEILTKEDLYSEAHRITLESILRLSGDGRTVNHVTLCDDLSKAGLIEKAGGVTYLAALTDEVPLGVKDATTDYCRIVREASTKRRLWNSLHNMATRCLDATDDADSLIEMTQEQIAEIAAGRIQKGFLSVDEIIKQEMSYFSRLFEKQSPITGIATGLRELDLLTRGLQPGELTIIAARPSLGKTALALSMMAGQGDRGVPVGFFSLEMNKASLVTRLLCMESKVNLHKIWSGFSNNEEIGKLMWAMSKVAKWPIYIDDTSGLSIGKLRAKARRLKAEHGAVVFYVDYLQLVTTDRHFNSRNDEVGSVASSLKQLAKDEKVPVVVLCQLNRAMERGPKRKPKLSDLRESGEIEQTADNVHFLWKPGKDSAVEDREGVEIDLVTGKQRNGPIGESKVCFLKGCTKFVECEPEEAQYPMPEE